VGTVGAKIEATKAPKRVGCGEGVSPSPLGEGSGEGAVPPPQKNFSILYLKLANFGANWVLFAQFT